MFEAYNNVTIIDMHIGINNLCRSTVKSVMLEVTPLLKSNLLHNYYNYILCAHMFTISQARQYTDVTKFSLRCLVCGTALTGHTDAQTHAQRTGHVNFGEV